MSHSAPEVTSPVTFPPAVAWLQRTIKARPRPFHLVFGVAIGLITVGFVVLTVVIILIATNFNLLGAIE